MFSCKATKVYCVNNLRLCVRLKHKTEAKVENSSPRTNSEVMNYLENCREYADIKDSIPKHLLRKYRTPENMYLINRKTAKNIASTLKKYLPKENPLVEVNPGFGFLSKELLAMRKGHIYMYESYSMFNEFISELEKQYPHRITYKNANFFGLWKLAFQDKMDNTDKLKQLLGDLATEDNDRVLNIVGAMPGLSFVKSLLTTLIFHNTSNYLGRPDLYLTMSIQNYEFLLKGKFRNMQHKSIPALFQLLYDHRILEKIPKEHYLPWLADSTKSTSEDDEHYLYLVNISQKQKLPCSADRLPLLWYFFRPHMISNATRVIPTLEQWIPGCGVWLITGQDPPDTDHRLGPTEDDAPLPHMNIFTQFGDLTLQQKLTVFKRFISWPEFNQCPYRATMENNLPKFISALDADSDKKRMGPLIDEEELTDHED